MGAVGGGIWYGIKGARNSPRVCASFTQFQQFPLTTCDAGRALSRCHCINKSPCTSNRRKLWYLGWNVLNIRLCGQGLPAEGGRLERYHLWVYDRWLLGTPKYVLSLSSPRTQKHSCTGSQRHCHFITLGGPKQAFGSAVACGILLGVFEGVGVVFGRIMGEGPPPQMAPGKQQQHSHLISFHQHAALTVQHLPSNSPCSFVMRSHESRCIILVDGFSSRFHDEETSSNSNHHPPPIHFYADKIISCHMYTLDTGRCALVHFLDYSAVCLSVDVANFTTVDGRTRIVHPETTTAYLSAQTHAQRSNRFQFQTFQIDKRSRGEDTLVKDIIL